MKITFVLPLADLAGGIRVIAIYAERLAERGHEVVVVSQPMARPTWRDHLRSFVKYGRLEVGSEAPASHLDGLKIPHRVLERARPVVDSDVPDADVIIATWWETAEWVAALSKKKGAKAHFIQHHEVFDYMPKERVKATWRLPLHKITISQWLGDSAREEYGDTHVTCVPNSVDTRQFHAPLRGRQPVPTVGLLYSSVPWKGCDISLAALSLASRKIPGIQLVSFGANPLPDSLPLPAGTKYHHNPPQDQLRDIYASCDVWLCGSREEGFGLPILEAMACRTPVIATPAGAAPELLKSGGGLLVRPEDPEDMSRAILKICDTSDAEWAAMSAQAHATAVSYTWADATDRFEQGLRRAIERHRAGEL